MIRQRWFALGIGVWTVVALVFSDKTFGVCDCGTGAGTPEVPEACNYMQRADDCRNCSSILGNGPCGDANCGIGGGETCEQDGIICQRMSYTEISDFQIQWPINSTGCTVAELETGFSTGGLWTNTPNGPLASNYEGFALYGMTDLTWPHHRTHVSVYRTYMGHNYSHDPPGDFGAKWYSNLSTYLIERSPLSADDCHDLGKDPCIELGGQGMAFSRQNRNTKFDLHMRSDNFALDYECITTASPVLHRYFLYDRSSGYTYTFEGINTGVIENYLDLNVVRTRNRYGQGEDYDYDSTDLLTKITIVGTSPAKEIYLDRDGVCDVITKIYDNYTGRTVDYFYADYDSQCWLTKVDGVGCGSCSAVPTVEYEYDAERLLTAIKDAEGHSRKILYTSGSFRRIRGVIDAKGQTHRYAFSGQGNHEHLSIDRRGNTIKYQNENVILDQQSTVTKVIALMDGGNNITYEYDYDDTFEITKVTAPDGATDQRFYDANRNLVSRTRTAGGVSLTTSATYTTDPSVQISTFTDELGNVFTYNYDSSGSLTKTTKPGALVAKYEYDDKGLFTKFISEAGVTHEYAYDALGFLTSTTVDSLETTYVVDAVGRRLTTTSPEGRKAIQKYDGGGRLTKRISAEGVEMRYEYDANKRQTARKLMDGGSPISTWSTEYDSNGNVTKRTAPGDLVTTYEYDPNDRLTKQTNSDDTVRELVRDNGCRVVTTKFGDTTSTSIIEESVYDERSNLLTQKDADGNMTRYEYDGFRRLTKTIDALDHYMVYEYDKSGRQTAVKGYNSQSAILTHSVTEYDALGRVTRTRQKAVPNGADGNDDFLSETVYDGEGRIETAKLYVDASNTNDTIYEYDTAGRQTRITDPDGHATTYAYDDDGLLTKNTDPNSHATTFAYDEDGRQTKVTDALGHYTETSYDVRGLQTDASNYASGGTPYLAQSVYEYDSTGRQTLSRRKSNPGGAIDNNADFVLKTFYDGDGRVTKTTGASGHDTTYAYDHLSRQTKVTLPDGSYATSHYDADGQLTKQIQYEIVSGTTHSFRTDSVYDALGRVVTTTNQGPDGTFGNGDDQDVIHVYDGAGRQISMTDEDGQVTVTEYDTLNRQTKVTEDSGGIGRVTNFVYDRAGRLDEIIAVNGNTGDQTTGYAYNGRRLQTIVTYEETGDVSMSYDAAGNMTKRTDEEGVAVDYEYDAADRLTKRRKNNSSTDIETYVYDGLGRMISAEKGTSANPDAVSRSVLTYDSLFRVQSESQAIAEGTAKTVSYDYDKGGNRTEMIHHGNAATATYAYDKRDRCTQIDNGTVRLADYTWLGGAVHRRDTTCDYPGNTKPKFRSDYQRDGLLRVTRLAHDHLTEDMADAGYSSLGTFAYTYDAASNVLTADQTASLGDLNVDRNYRYDTLDRLTHADLDERQAFNLFWQPTHSTYEYDNLGNRKTHIHRDSDLYLVPPTLVYEHDKANRMSKIKGEGSYSGTFTPAYDKAGNQTFAYAKDRGTSYKYSYDHNNRLLAVHDDTGTTRKAALTYDALGRRIEYINDVTGDTVRYYYDGVNEIVETNASGSELRHYIHGISYVDERLMLMRHDLTDADDDRPYYYVVDRQYNVWMVVDRAGAIVERYAYDPYGRPLIRESAGRGDMNNDTDVNGTDNTRFLNELGNTIWDPRADMNDDGSVNTLDLPAFNHARDNVWTEGTPAVSQAFSDVDNPFMFQGRPHFAIDTGASETSGRLMLNDHRARFSNVATGRWNTRDPAGYVDGWNLFSFERSSPMVYLDPSGYWHISRIGAARALAVPETGDTPRTLASLTRLEPNEYMLWMIPVTNLQPSTDCTTTDCVVSNANSLVPTTCVYSVPNTVIAVWGALTWAESWYHPFSVWWGFRTNMNTELAGFRQKGFNAVEYNKPTAKEVNDTHLRNTDMAVFLYAGHSNLVGDLLPRLSGPTGPRVVQKLHRDSTQGLYKLAGLKLLGCNTATQAFSDRKVGILTATWNTNVSRAGAFVGYVGSPSFWDCGRPIIMPGTGGVSGR